MTRSSLLVLLVSLLVIKAAPAGAQADADGCGPYVLNGTVLECAAAGSARDQLRRGTFIAGSAATGETLAQAIGIEVATAPFGSSSGGFTYTFDRNERGWRRTSPTFGPSFAERALTIGKGKLSTGFNILARRYDTVDGLDLDGFGVFRFEGGSLAVSESRVELDVQTDTLAAFAHYGLFDNFDLGVMVPYVRVSTEGWSRIFGQTDEELQRVRLDRSANGIGDIAIMGKYRFWQSARGAAASLRRNAAMAVAVIARIPSGDSDELLGLGTSRTLVSFIGSATTGRFSPHLNVGYEIWSDAVTTSRDFQGDTTLSVRDQVVYNAGIEFELHSRLTVVADVVGRYLKGGGQVGYQPFAYPPNLSNVRGAEALVAVPHGFNTVILAPGAKWNVYGSALLTASMLITTTDGGLRDIVTPVVGIDWGF